MCASTNQAYSKKGKINQLTRQPLYGVKAATRREDSNKYSHRLKGEDAVAI